MPPPPDNQPPTTMDHGITRMVDAAANRAREALRVMEDTARFALNHAPLCALLKALRHDLQQSLAALTPDRFQLLSARDTPGDVGTAISTPSEFSRNGLPAIIAAAASRLTESLRTLEECAKAANPSAARALEQLRYRAYTHDQQLTAALGAYDQRRQWRLCVLLTESLCAGRPWMAIAQAAIAGGADCLQLREKTLESRELLTRARALASLCRSNNVACIINDRIDIALLSGADGVHLGQHDLSLRDARRLCGSRLLIGVSTEHPDQARAAIEEGADYCGIGPMFPTNTKHKPRLAGPAYLGQYLADPALARIPHLAIGGINPENVAQLTALGARGVAVSSAVCGAQDVEAACRAVLQGVPGTAKIPPARAGETIMA